MVVSDGYRQATREIMSRTAITFDFHNTLVHCDPWFELEVRTLPGAFLRWHQTHRSGFAHEHAVPALERGYRRLRSSIIQHGHELTAERSLAVVLSQAGFHVPRQDLEDGVRELMRETIESATAVTGAIETVQALSADGHALGVVSSAVYHPFLEWALEKLGIAAAFDVVVTSASCGYYKSRPEIYWEALTSLGASPSGSVHVGDSSRFDVAGAARAGMRTVWLNPDESDIPAPAPDLMVTTLSGSAADIAGLSGERAG